MLVSEIYKRYSIPINLQEHMLRVAAVGDVVIEHFEKKLKLDRDLVIKTLLLHDMGNIIKYDFSKLDLLAEEDKVRVGELRRIQREFIKKYGKETDKVTVKILRELGVDERVIDLCENSHGEYSDQFADGDDWERKLAYYADMRIGPLGVKGVRDRFDDLIKRNPGEKAKLLEYLDRCLKIEGQLQKVVGIDLQKIDDQMIGERMKELRFTHIRCV